MCERCANNVQRDARANGPCRTCTLHGRVLFLKQDDQHLHYKTAWPDRPNAFPTPPSSRATEAFRKDDTEDLLRRYFSLNLNLSDLYEQWSLADPNFKKKAPQFTGVRILSQDAWEALVCFICSSNNNISRISQMVRSLATGILHHCPLSNTFRYTNFAYIMAL